MVSWPVGLHLNKCILDIAVLQHIQLSNRVATISISNECFNSMNSAAFLAFKTNKNKHNAELQLTDPGTKATGKHKEYFAPVTYMHREKEMSQVCLHPFGAKCSLVTSLTDTCVYYCIYGRPSTTFTYCHFYNFWTVP